MLTRNDVVVVLVFSMIITTLYSIIYTNFNTCEKSSGSSGVIIYPEIKENQSNMMVIWCKSKVQCLKMTEAVYFEARGEGVKGMFAVAHVIQNRVIKNSSSVTEEVMKDSQFSYTDRKDFSITEPDKYREAMVVSAKVLTGLSKDVTKGSTHYVAPKRLKKMPRWTKALTPTIAINNHVFYRG